MPPGPGFIATLNMPANEPIGTSYAFVAFATTAAASPAPLGGPYVPLPPKRILDTRAGSGLPYAGQTLAANSTLNVNVTNVGGVPPAGVGAVVLNVTVVNPTATSYLTLFPAGGSTPLAANLVFNKGQVVPNLVEVAVGTNGQVAIYNNSGSVDVIADVQGYVQAIGEIGAAGMFKPLPPSRILDTRTGSGQPGAGQTIHAAATITVQATGIGGVPSTGVAAVVLNVTVTNATASSYLTAFPAGTSLPLAANLNFNGGQTISNRVIVPVNTSGQISLYNSQGSVDVIADVGGWFTDSTIGGVGSQFVGIVPQRLLDTRSGTGGITAPIGPGQTVSLMVAGNAGVPAMSSIVPPTAVVLNVTAVAPSALSFLTAWPGAATKPLAADILYGNGQIVPNLVVVQLGADGSIQLYNDQGTVNVVADVVGYYQ
jgi:hypothetical protein